MDSLVNCTCATVRFLCYLAIAFGLFKLFSFARSVFSFVHRFYFLKRLDLLERYGKGSWAVVTGSTAGIGLEFAHQLAALGFNIVLVSRSLDKLKSCAEEVKKAHPGVETAVVQADFASDTSLAFYERIHSQIAGKDVSILVNNAGVAETGRVASLPAAAQKGIIDTNAVPVVMLTRMFLPQLLRREKRSAVLNTSSIMGNFLYPGMAMYSGTKSFVNKFSLGLSFETAEKIDVMSLTPGFVETKMTEGAKLQFCITPQMCVSGALDSLGQEKITYGHYKHTLHGALIYTMQTYLTQRYLKRVLGLMDHYYKNAQSK